MEQLVNISKSTQFTEVYHLLQSTVESFMRNSANCPKVLLKVLQNIYGRFDEAIDYIFRAANTMDMPEKRTHLSEARRLIFCQFSSIEMLVKAKGITVGQANETLLKLKEVYEQTNKWYNSCAKYISSDEK